MIKKFVLLFFVITVLVGTLPATWQSGNSIKVMNVRPNAVAYDFSVIALNQNWPYLALFHAESYQKSYCWGDSVGGRYGNSVWNPLGTNRFGTHYYNQDLLITRSISSAHDSEYMESNGCQVASGAANPIMIFNGKNAWGIYYLSLRKENNKWRHYLMVAMVDPNHMNNVHNAGMWYFGRVNKPACTPNGVCYPGENWHNEQPQGGKAALVGKNLKYARPVFETGTGKRIMSACQYSNQNWTQGLLGTITASPDHKTFYYFYLDIVKVGSVYQYQLLRRTMNPAMTQFSKPKKIKVLAQSSSMTSGWNWMPLVRVNYHSTINKYVVIYNSVGNGKMDLSIQLSNNPDLSDITLNNSSRTDSAVNGLKLYNDPGIPKDANGHYTLGQFNIKKDGWGHHFRGGGSNYDAILYFPVNPVRGQVGPYGVSIYGKGVNLR